MTAAARDVPGQSVVKAARLNMLKLRMTVPIGATGAVGTIVSDDGAWGLTRGSAGTYTGTFPKSLKGNIRVTYVGDGTVKGHYFTAFDPAAGTFGVKFHDAATPTTTDPESGAVLYFEVDLDEGT